MKHSILLTVVAILAIFLFRNLYQSKYNKIASDQKVQEEYLYTKAEKQDGIFLAQQREFELTKDISLGYVPKYRLIKAYEDLLKERRSGKVNRTQALTWTERGPYKDKVGPSNGNGRVQSNNVTSGRIRAIWFDLADATNRTVWVGGVDGGLWRTTNITTTPAFWAQINDSFGNLAIADICQDPSNHDIMYFGTGEKTFNHDAVRGGGIWKSTDHGVTWNLLLNTTTFWNVSRIVCDALGNVYVATIGSGNDAGIRRSTDKGLTWSPISISPDNLSPRISEMEISSTGRLHITCGYRDTPTDEAGYVYTDNPSSVTSNPSDWTAPITSFSPVQYNVDIAVSGDNLYALPSDAASQTSQVWKSTDGGANWVKTATSPSVVGPARLSGGQAWYCLGVAIDPADSDKVMVGGLNSYITANGGGNWNINSVWVTGVPGSANYIHADHQVIVWKGNRILDGGDGGIFYSGDGGATFTDKNVGLRLKQFYSVAIHPLNTDYFLGGTQDNGCQQLTEPGLSESVEVTGGDGAFMHIDQDEPQYQFASSTYSNYRRSTNGGATWPSVNYGDIGQFINPTDYDDVLNKMYTSGAPGTYLRWENPQTGGTFTTVPIALFGGSSVSHVSVSPHTANRVFFGTASGRVVRVDNANLPSPGATTTNITGNGMSASSVSSVAIGTTDNNLLATFSNYGSHHVWVSTSGGTFWTNATGDLPDIPVRWAMFYPEDNTKAILGTDLGIYETTNINVAVPVWVQDPNFPVARVDMLQYRKSDGIVAAATHGRGIWTAPIPLVPYVRFAFDYNYQPEVTAATTGCRGYKDYVVNMIIDKAPTGDANVTLFCNGTAKEGLDLDFTTNGDFVSPSHILTFASGSIVPQPITIRIYDDAEKESNESFTLTYDIGAGTNAQHAPSSLDYTFTISDNEAPDYFSGNFFIGPYNAIDSFATPFRSDLQKFRMQSLYTSDELRAAGISSAANIVSMNLRVISKNSTRPYTGFTISLANTTANDLSTGFIIPVFREVFTANYSSVVGDNLFAFITPFAWDGTSNLVVQICFDNEPSLADAFPDITEGTFSPLGDGVRATTYSNLIAGPGCSLGAAFSSPARATVTFGANSSAIETVLNNNKTENVSNNGAYYFYASATGNIMNSISGASASLGCVSSKIFEAGTTWQTFQGGHRSQKVFDIIPSTNPGASYTVGLYFTAAELAGKDPTSLRIAKTTAATMAAANSGNTVIGPALWNIYGTGYFFTAFFTGLSKFFLVDNDVVLQSPLPVILLNFKGQLQRENIALEWTTTAEHDSKAFDIEKSYDGVNFSKIGTVKAAGSSASLRKYEYLDPEIAPEVNYYRLKMMDIDANSKFSQVILIRNPGAVQQLFVLNNPFSDFINIRFAKISKGKVRIQLTDLAGKQMVVAEYDQFAQQILRFNTSGKSLSKGVYVLQADVEGKRYTKKVVKQ